MRFSFPLALAAFSAGLLGACSDDAASGDIVIEELGGQQEIAEPVGGKDRPSNLDEATEGESNVAIWQVSDEDTVVYLLGTVHLMKPGVEWQTQDIRTAFNQAEAVFLEADVFSREAQRAMGLVVTQTAELKNDMTLSDFFEKKDQKRIDEALGELDLSLSQLNNFRPWFATMQMSVLSLIKAGGDPASGADVIISREMLERGVPLRYLETAAQQIQMLANGDDERDAAYFLEVLDDLEEGEAYYADLMGAWYEGDVERVDYLINSAFADYPKLRERLITDRNADWSQQIDRVLTDEPGTFVVAVGAGHLAGDASLQDMLRGRGYDVERL
ncbi:TraB/GumN family protein [Parvularcula sp. ZS-1/3]|uniref:TraB/GumN family protein n=1 Tax=Parvularcula mediterranea TaxID=2732508 RepID=A0A7Y3W4K3_9PROT|nr:TraB/GumN family protein [Parvularcula mediterranea]NNU15845.1 TraB/GumN family protein [Parvularcula mediterranea]